MSDRHRAHSGRYALIRQYVKITPVGAGIVPAPARGRSLSQHREPVLWA